MRARGVVFGFSFLLVLGAFAVLAQPRAAGLDLTGMQGGDLSAALQGFGGLDPRTASNADKKVLELIYDQLGRVDEATLQVTPWAATRWTWDGAKNITVTLRDDLLWSDGSAVTASDVEWSLERYQRGGVSRWTVVVVDPTTLRFDFTAFDPGSYNYRTTNVAGPGLFFTEALTASIAWKNGDSTSDPTGPFSGPFAVQSYTAGSQLVLAANEHHFSGRPNLDTVTFLWPYTLALDATGNTTATDAGCALMLGDVHLIGWALLSNDLTNTRDCQAGFGGFPGRPSDYRESLQSLDLNRTAKHVAGAKNAGPDFLYFGFTFNAASMFNGGPGSEGQKLRSSLYWWVNKANYLNVEGAGSTRIANGPINAMDAPWHPASCAPWTPCDTIVDAGFTGSGATTGTNTNPGRLNLTVNGFLDRDADGIRDLSTGAPITFRILAPDFNVDPRKTTIADDLSFLMRTFGGIDVTAQFYGTQAALDAAIDACKTSGSCMYVSRYTGATTLPDWLYGMPEILAAGDGTADLHLNLGAATCYQLSCRQLHVGHVGHLVGAAADFLPVLHYEALEAYDFQTFEGWVSMFGGLNNFWTYVRLHRPMLSSLSTVVILPETTLTPGGTTEAIVTVQDANGNPVTDAEVELSASAGTLAATTGVTGAGGEFRTGYTAPASVSRSMDVWITATAAKAQYVGDEGAATLTVHAPPLGQFLVEVTVTDLDHEIPSGNTTGIVVLVLDRATLAFVVGATVNLRTNLPGASIDDPTGVTDALGMFSTTISAEVTQGMQYLISAEASMSGYASASDTTSLVVLGDFSEPVQEVDSIRNVPGFEAAYALGAVAVVFALVVVARRRRDA